MLLRICIQSLTNRSSHFTRFSIRCIHTEKIIAQPLKSLVTDRVSIRGEGFQPKTPLTIKASIDCTAELVSFVSHGHIVTSTNGCFDLSTSESVGGTYHGIDGMGLFWSMEKTGNSLGRINVNDSRTILKYNFEVFHGHHDNMAKEIGIAPVCNTVIERCFLATNVKRNLINDEIIGTLFTPPGDGPFPAVIIMYGGTKRRQLFEDAAAIFANNGFVALNLAYFAVEGLPENYTDEDIRIEYFERAVQYLTSLKCVKSDAIGVYGQSMGGVISLAMANFLPQIKCAACIGGYVTGMGSRITYKGNLVEPISWVLEKSAYCKDGRDDYWQFNITHPEKEPSSIIPIENVSADILIIAGLQDTCNTNLHADVAKRRMDNAQKTNYEIFKFPNMGHLFDAPFMPVAPTAGHVYFPQGTEIYYGGADIQMHSTDVQESWRCILSYFKQSLGNS